MTYTIRVQRSPEYSQVENPDLFVKNFNTVEEFQAVTNLFDNKRRISWLESLIIPVRTHNPNNFCEDFFAPSLFNQALKTKDVALKIFCCIIDVITFPLRLITVIPRCIYNAMHPKAAHPFYQYLINNGLPAAHLSAGHIYLETEWMEKRKGLGQFQIIRGNTFNFIHLPKNFSNIKNIVIENFMGHAPKQPKIIEIE